MQASVAQRPHILIIEDDHGLSDELAMQLGASGYQARQCYDGDSGLNTALNDQFSLILLDVLLPGLDGFALLNRLRKYCSTPVIMLTARGAEEDRISGFQCGADDYLPKPFSITELMLRIEAVIRRSAGHRAVPAAATEQLRFDALTLDKTEQQVRYQDQQLVLTDMEFRLLWMLIECRGEVQSKSHLYQQLMQRPFSRYDRSIDMHISNLRRKLKRTGFAASRLVTMHGQGYCLK
ncbi:response regulator transcription factor [Aliamphritea hakodatensis]|uniref:response regulator transcription factor n=1 Tax=Aliamphritea hakodatensis TaxID=2895352 RepID=UPI0022FD450A|nr:response regulator transcription factor [Aliamphritea hakodatensis]